MPYSKKRLLEIKKERKERKKEKERLKKEKEKEKKKEKERLKSLKRKIKLKKKYNKKFNLLRKKKELARRNEMGDERGIYCIYITKNRKKVRYLGYSKWKTSAYAKYNDFIDRNRKKAVFPKTTETNRKNGSHETVGVKYEILLVKKADENEKTTNAFRNEYGKFVENIIEDWEGHIIVEKNDWFVEETFSVYGYHPIKERKTYSFILENLLLNDDDCGDDMKSVMVYKNRVIIQHVDDFDLITCYDSNQSKQMYDMFQKDVSKLGKKYIVFMGETNSPKWIDKIEEKTGWNRISIIHKTTAN